MATAKTEQKSPRQQPVVVNPDRRPRRAPAKPNSPEQAPPRQPRFSWARWCDEWKMTLAATLMAWKKPRFILTVVLTVLIFGTLMNLLSNGLSQFTLLFKLDWSGKWALLEHAFLAVFGVGRAFIDWLSVFAVALLQGILLGLVVVVWHYNKSQNATAPATADRAASTTTGRTASTTTGRPADATSITAAANQNTANAQSAGIVAGLAVLSAGCPTCGTSLLLPIIGMFTSAGGALAGVISGVVYAVAILVALWALKRVGREAYAVLLAEHFARTTKHAKPSASPEKTTSA